MNLSDNRQKGIAALIGLVVLSLGYFLYARTAGPPSPAVGSNMTLANPTGTEGEPPRDLGMSNATKEARAKELAEAGQTPSPTPAPQ